jgi:DNA-directed RNA polymerase specialized sigma24 family protein
VPSDQAAVRHSPPFSEDGSRENGAIASSWLFAVGDCTNLGQRGQRGDLARGQSEKAKCREALFRAARRRCAYMNESAEIVKRLDSLIRLVAAGVCANKSQRDSIEILNAAGLAPKQIAEFLGTSPNTVSVTLSAMKRKAKRPAKVAEIEFDSTGSV